MPNYNYRPNDYMRRSQCQRTVMPPQPKSEHNCTLQAETPNCDTYNEDVLHVLPLAMAYVPWQEFKHLYSVEKALCRGTIFEKLDKPFLGIGGCQK